MDILVTRCARYIVYLRLKARKPLTDIYPFHAAERGRAACAPWAW